MEEGGLGLRRRAGAARLVWEPRRGHRGRWVFQVRAVLVEAQGDGVVLVIVLRLGVVGTQQECTWPALAPCQRLGEGLKHAPQVPELGGPPFQIGTMTPC